MPSTEADDMPERGQPYVGALVAVGLSLMSQDATLCGGREQDLVFLSRANRLHALCFSAPGTRWDRRLATGSDLPAQARRPAADRGSGTGRGGRCQHPKSHF
jgi:hypothetical protein